MLLAPTAVRAARPDPQRSSLGRSNGFGRSAIAGGVAAAAATVVFHPLDTVKTVLQSGAAQPLREIQSLRIGGLYRGVLPAAASMMPACAVRMGSYEVLKAALLLRAPELPPAALVAVASSLSVVCSCAVRVPLDGIKVAVQAGAAPSAAAALRAAWGSGGRAGVARLYRGVGPALLRDVPFFSINLLAYERLKLEAQARAERRRAAPSLVAPGPRRVPSLPAAGARAPSGRRRPPAELTPTEAVWIGAASQGIAGLLTNPADVIKTRVQSALTPQAARVGAALTAALSEGGAAALMRGAAARVLWIAPQGCVYYPVYEAMHAALAECPAS